MTQGDAGVYKAINELQTVLVGLVEDARQESREDHLALLKRLDAHDERLRHIEKKQEPTPWPPLKLSDVRAAEASADGDNRPLFRVTFADVKRWGWAFAAFGALVTGVNLAAEFIMRALTFVGFHR